MAQDEPERSGAVLVTDPVLITVEEYDGELTYQTPTLPPALAVQSGQLPAYELQSLPEAVFLRTCTYSGSLRIWRFRGQVTAPLRNAVSDQLVATQVFQAELSPECEAGVSIT